jgi:alkanesulfonate monooxygenase SsuD/methylene tetrahydromethanopterin reductase-like flavin-dependent oxidoreductase (luciferase family)
MAKVGLVFSPRDPAQVAETIKVMEDRGFSFAGLLDTPARSMDVYVALTIAAANSSRIRIGPCVTNPNTRDISVTAAAISSVELAAPGRTYLGISKGFSGTAAIAVATSKTSSLAEVVPQLRGLIAGQPVKSGDRSMTIFWGGAKIPIYIAASGPMAMRIAGKVADGVIMHMGHFPEIVSDAFGYLDSGAREAGRTADDLDVWLYGAGECRADGDAARESVKGAIAGMGASVFSPNLKGKRVPAGLEASANQLRTDYALTQHMTPGVQTNEHLIDRLGLTNYLLDRFAFTGTAREIRDKQRRLEACGIRNFLINISMSTAPTETVRALSDALEPER